MAEGKKSFIGYCDWWHIFEELTDDEAGRLIKHFFRYINDQNPTAPDRTTQLVFKPIQLQLKRDLVSWEQTKEKLSKAGKRGMEQRWKKKDNEVKPPITSDNHLINSITPITVTVNDNVNVTVKQQQLKLETVFEVMRMKLDRSLYSDDLVQAEAKKFFLRYKHEQIRNLGNLIGTVVQGFQPDIKPKQMIY